MQIWIRNDLSCNSLIIRLRQQLSKIKEMNDFLLVTRIRRIVDLSKPFHTLYSARVSFGGVPLWQFASKKVLVVCKFKPGMDHNTNTFYMRNWRLDPSGTYTAWGVLTNPLIDIYG